MIAIGVEIEKPSAAVKRSGALKMETTKMAIATGAAKARAVKRRVAERGKPVDRFPAYSTNKVYRTTAYADKAGAPKPLGEGRGVSVYASSQAFHSRRQTGTFNVTGGMWDGLSVVPKGKGRAENRFRGRSLGGDPLFSASRDDAKRRAARAKKRQRLREGKRIRAVKVSNAIKAGSVAATAKVNVLKPTNAERVAVADVIGNHLGLKVHSALGGTKFKRGRTRGDQRLAADLERQLMAATASRSV